MNTTQFFEQLEASIARYDLLCPIGPIGTITNGCESKPITPTRSLSLSV